MLRNKKLERQLLAAGIEIEESYGNDYGNDGQYTQCFFLKSGDCRFEMKKTFIKCKEVMKFKGNNWDGLYNRLKKDSQWEAKWRNIYYYTNKYYSGSGSLLYVPDCELTPDRQHIPIKHKPHQIWKFLDKIDAAKAKGGKQTVKFKGNEYEFDFPSVIIEECNEHTEEQLKELIPATLKGKRAKRIAIDKTLRTMTKEDKESEKGKALIQQRRLIVKAYNNQCEEIRKQEPKEPAWKSVTGWDSVKDMCVKNFIISATPDNKRSIMLVSKEPRLGYFATEKQAQQILALSQLTQIHKAMMEGEKLVNFNDTGERGFIYSILFSRKCRHNISSTTTDLGFKVNCTPFEIDFYTEEQRNHFIKHNEDLINQYLGL